MGKALVFDCRSYVACFKYLALRRSHLHQYEKVLVFFPSNLELSTLADLLKQETRTEFYSLDVRSDDKSCFTFGYRKLVKKIGKVMDEGEKIDLLSSFPNGLLYAAFLDAMPRRQFGERLVIDDGFSNCLPRSYCRPDSINFRVKRIALGFFLGRTIYNILGFFNLDEVDWFFTIYKESTPEIFKHKVIDVTAAYTRFFVGQSRSYDIESRSVLFLGHHAIQSGRLTQGAYHKMVSDILHKYAGQGRVYYSAHHAEGSENNDFYTSLGMLGDFSLVPSELLIASGRFAEVIGPYNTTLIEADRLNILSSIRRYIGYMVPGSPDIELRKMQTQMVCLKNNILLLDVG